jgi:ComF family protein
MQRKVSSISQLLRVPSLCLLCKQYHDVSLAVCDACIEYFSTLEHKCRYCSFPLPDSNYAICGACAVKNPAFDKVITTYRFEEPLRTLLHEFKYEEGLYLLKVIAKLMLNAFTETDAETECLIPVPMHPKRIRARGFNQSVELAKYLSKIIHRPYDVNLCTKIKNTPPLASMDAKARKKNIKNTFHCKPSSYQHVTLVDDLLTTGSTANELSATLKKSGISKVTVWCCARAYKD